VKGRALHRIREVRGEDVRLEDLIGRRLMEVFPEHVGSALDNGLQRAVREQKTAVFESYSPLPDRWLEVHAYPSADGGLSMYARNITERRRVEEDLARMLSQQAAVAESGSRRAGTGVRDR
jgi:hypothetical protein